MKHKYNILGSIIGDEMKSKPHWFSTNLWRLIKDILSDIRYLMVDDILSTDELELLYEFINIRLNDIGDRFDPKEVYEAHNYVYAILDWYLKMSIEQECYESSANLRNLIDKLCVSKVINNHAN